MSALPPRIDTLPVRPSPKVGESLTGYCWRVLASNGRIESPFGFSTPTAHTYSSQRHSEVLEESLLGIKLAFKLRQHETRQLARVRLANLAGWCRPTGAPFFCPACWREDPFFRLAWQLPLNWACAVHGSWLVRQCSACCRNLTWSRIGLGLQCHCGHRLLVDEPEAASAGWVRLSRELDVALALGTELTPEEAGLRDPLREIYEAIDWARRACQSLRPHASTASGRRREVPWGNVVRLITAGDASVKRQVHRINVSSKRWSGGAEGGSSALRTALGDLSDELTCNFGDFQTVNPWLLRLSALARDALERSEAGPPGNVGRHQ